jgi:hypothetical protein
MEFKTDLMDSLRSRILAGPAAAPDDALAWPELHARLAAAHAAAQALAEGRTARTIRFGGFENWGPAVSAQRNILLGVNPTDLADGKSARCNKSAIAGKTMAGDRGQ